MDAKKEKNLFYFCLIYRHILCSYLETLKTIWLVEISPLWLTWMTIWTLYFNWPNVLKSAWWVVCAWWYLAPDCIFIVLFYDCLLLSLNVYSDSSALLFLVTLQVKVWLRWRVLKDHFLMLHHLLRYKEYAFSHVDTTIVPIVYQYLMFIILRSLL